MIIFQHYVHEHFIFCFLCCRIAIFSVSVLKDDRIVVVAEQRPQCTEEEVSTKC